MSTKRARKRNDSAFHLTAVPTRLHYSSRVDCRTPQLRAVEAVLAALATDPPAAERSSVPVDRTNGLPGETSLWLTTITDALECAEAIRRHAPLPASGSCAARHRNPTDYNDFARSAERRVLRLWVVGDYVGSLRWIADHVGLGDDLVNRIRERIEAAIRGTGRRVNARAAA